MIDALHASSCKSIVWHSYTSANWVGTKNKTKSIRPSSSSLIETWTSVACPVVSFPTSWKASLLVVRLMFCIQDAAPSYFRLIETVPFILHKRLLFPQSKYDTAPSPLICDSRAAAALRGILRSLKRPNSHRESDRMWCKRLLLTALQAATNRWCSKHLRLRAVIFVSHVSLRTAWSQGNMICGRLLAGLLVTL